MAAFSDQYSELTVFDGDDEFVVDDMSDDATRWLARKNVLAPVGAFLANIPAWSEPGFVDPIAGDDTAGWLTMHADADGAECFAGFGSGAAIGAGFDTGDTASEVYTYAGTGGVTLAVNDQRAHVDVRAQTGQTLPLLDLRDEGGTTVFSVGPDGDATFPNGELRTQFGMEVLSAAVSGKSAVLGDANTEDGIGNGIFYESNSTDGLQRVRICLGDGTPPLQTIFAADGTTEFPGLVALGPSDGTVAGLSVSSHDDLQLLAEATAFAVLSDVEGYNGNRGLFWNYDNADDGEQDLRLILGDSAQFTTTFAADGTTEFPGDAAIAGNLVVAPTGVVAPTPGIGGASGPTVWLACDGDNGVVQVTDTLAQGGTQNNLQWITTGVDGEQYLFLQLGSSGQFWWNFAADGSTEFPGDVSIAGNLGGIGKMLAGIPAWSEPGFVDPGVGDDSNGWIAMQAAEFYSDITAGFGSDSTHYAELAAHPTNGGLSLGADNGASVELTADDTDTWLHITVPDAMVQSPVLIRTASSTRLLEVGSDGVSTMQGLLLTNLPTSDPHIAGQVYNDTGTLKISAG